MSGEQLTHRSAGRGGRKLRNQALNRLTVLGGARMLSGSEAVEDLGAESVVPTVYVETTIPSYLAALPSRDLVVAAHQQVTHYWWRSARSRFDLFVSEAVLVEIQAGDQEAAERRMNAVSGLPVLALNDDVRTLAHEYETRLGLGVSGRADLPHFAFAVAYGLDFLVTWNCRHIANGQVIRRLMTANAVLGWATPIIVTPEELMVGPEEAEV